MPYCRACPARIVFAQQHPTARNPYPASNPLNEEPSPDGNLRLDRGVMRYDVLTGTELVMARAAGEELYLSHFATCPARRKFRKETHAQKS